MKLEQSSLAATLSVRAHKGTLPLIAQEHLSRHRTRNVSAARCGRLMIGRANLRCRPIARVSVLRRRRTRVRWRFDAEARLQRLVQQEIHSALHDDREVAVRHLMSHEVLQLLELVMQCLMSRPLQPVAAGSKRRPGAALGGRRLRFHEKLLD